MPFPPTDPLRPWLARLLDPAPPPVRLCFAAAHVVLRPSYAALGHTFERPGPAAEVAAHVDWDTTMALRTHLDGHGFGTAEAMDTAQRFELGWDAARELIARTGALGLRHGFVAGAGTDHLPAVRGVDDLVDGVAFQARFIQRCGGMPMLLPMPFLARSGADADTYVAVYRAIVRQLDGPLFVHWLGPMFNPALQGYFPGDSFARVLALDPGKVRGCKLSLLDDAQERRVRAEIRPRRQIVLTGDDFHFGDLICGGTPGGPPPAITGRTRIGAHDVRLGDFSHALLGVFDAIARPAGVAMRLLAQGDANAARAVLAPCETLGQHVFAAPTRHYKVGLAFLAFLDGRQDNAMLVQREDRCRDRAHLRRAAELAAACGAFADPAAAAARLQAWEARGGEP